MFWIDHCKESAVWRWSNDPCIQIWSSRWENWHRIDRRGKSNRKKHQGECFFVSISISFIFELHPWTLVGHLVQHSKHWQCGWWHRLLQVWGRIYGCCPVSGMGMLVYILLDTCSPVINTQVLGSEMGKQFIERHRQTCPSDTVWYYVEMLDVGLIETLYSRLGCIRTQRFYL